MGSDFADAGEQAVGYRTNSAMNTGAAILGSCAGRSPAYSALRLVCSALSPPFATDWTVAWADGIPLVVGQLLKRFGLLGVWSGGERSAAPGRGQSIKAKPAVKCCDAPQSDVKQSESEFEHRVCVWRTLSVQVLGPTALPPADIGTRWRHRRQGAGRHPRQ